MWQLTFYFLYLHISSLPFLITNKYKNEELELIPRTSVKRNKKHTSLIMLEFAKCIQMYVWFYLMFKNITLISQLYSTSEQTMVISTMDIYKSILRNLRC